MGGLPVKNKPPSVSASPATRLLRRAAANGHPPETPCHLGCKQRAPASSVQPISSASEGPVCHRTQTTSRHRRARRTRQSPAVPRPLPQGLPAVRQCRKLRRSHLRSEERRVG